MDILRCRTPELVRKEIWTHILAYNLIRTIIAQSAMKHGVEPRSISFKGAIQTLEAFQPMIAMQAQRDARFRQRLFEQLLDAIIVHRVADRPDRYEPRRRKRHSKRYGVFIKPRHEAKREMANGVRDKYVPFVDATGKSSTRECDLPVMAASTRSEIREVFGITHEPIADLTLL